MNQEDVHYAKCSIRQFAPTDTRPSINMDLVHTETSKLLKLKWKMTDQKRELWNNVRGTADEHWDGFSIAYDAWSELRSKHGHGVKLWIGKLHKRNTYVRNGQSQPSKRLNHAVSLMVWHKQDEYLKHYLYLDNWQHTQWFQPQAHVYNQMWDYRNPNTSPDAKERTTLSIEDLL